MDSTPIHYHIVTLTHYHINQTAMRTIIQSIFLCCLLQACVAQEGTENEESQRLTGEDSLVNESIKEVLSPYAVFLKNLPVKPKGSPVLLYNGQQKGNQDAHVAVVDMELSRRDLQQCADAVMRLRGEFLFSQKRFDEIHFNFLSDGKPRFFLNYSKGDTSYASFRRYMDWVFTYANTRSLHGELEPVSIEKIQAGDVFIVTGRPFGHAVIVTEVAKQQNGQVRFRLAQSYMPAQETHILKNPLHPDNGGWYFLHEIGEELYTPEWTFPSNALRRFPAENNVVD